MTTSLQTYQYPEGDIYEGEWSKEGKKHGIGRLIFNDGSMYEGRFMNGWFSGYGTLIFPDRTVYAGEFQDGLFHGFGVYVRSDGMKYEGSYREGKPYGPGLITFADGTSGNPRLEGYFEGTKLLRREHVPEFIKRARASRERASVTTLENGGEE